jgi:hypothetical protein
MVPPFFCKLAAPRPTFLGFWQERDLDQQMRPQNSNLTTSDHIERKLMLLVIYNSRKNPLKTMRKNKVELLAEYPKTPPHSKVSLCIKS